MRVVSTEEMRDLEKVASDDLNLSSLMLMENAGIGAAEIISKILSQRYPGVDPEVLVFCGRGKNGGDGLVVARQLLARGGRVRVFLMHKKEDHTGETAHNLSILERQKAKIVQVPTAAVVEEYFQSAASRPFVVVDALLGTGISRPIEGAYFDTVQSINRHADTLISLDVPSGTDANNGSLWGSSAQATHTITFGYPKIGLYQMPAASKRGRLYCVPLSFPSTWGDQGDKRLLNESNTATLLQSRDRFGHKNSFGHTLFIGGSPGRLGAVVMASQAALKMGSGLVTVASWPESYPSLENKLSPEVMNFKISKESGEFYVPKPGLNAFSSIVAGPGLGVSEEAAQLLQQLIKLYTGALVLDADALNILAEFKLQNLLLKRVQPTVLTPHPGEMARLLGVDKNVVVEQPIHCVRQAVEATTATVVLKGATSFVHSAEGITWINHYPNDGMATAGSGDVLAGMIGGLMGQGMSAVDSAKCGVFLHSLSGKAAAERFGHRSMTAGSIIENISTAFATLAEFQSP